MPTMIYHAPYALNPDSVSASAIRPIKMLQAFRDSGFEVLDITGHAAERRKRFAALRRRVENGQKIDFMYSENATIPPSVTEPRHIPPHPFLDAEIFRFAKKHGIPSGVFYRDLYWKFEEYDNRVGQPLASIMKVLYRAELRTYNRYCHTIFLPSLEMGEYLPEFDRPNTVALPPGGDTIDSPGPQDGVSIFYVGGVGDHYRMHNLVRAVSELDGVRLTICTDAKRWESVAHEYPEAGSHGITVVHKSGPELDVLYRDANLCSVAFEQLDYREFASPFKFYEYIGRGKPIIGTDGALTGKLVNEMGIGWTTDNSVAAIKDVLTRLRDNPQELARVTQHCESVRDQHSWPARAQKVARTLTESRS
ncbi:hypothetical protein SAMN02910418_00107 [Bowdeniella nasicola]|uniref:Uncharacterized protein n=1 Tax=Bowdeniella nasicola TaxID=208480 RepID=A0A1H3VL47_9ACTO|nr:hypothetical protein [Bowdeniella nasicola]SDZ74984.1 hypothetical protein SAMN02910418_00107 [Bowdeniella nasicola]